LRKHLASLGFACLLSACGGFVHDEQLDRSYRLVAVDTSDDMIVCRRFTGADCVGDELPGPTVFAAGANPNYVVIARHPRGEQGTDKSVTEYYYVKRPPEDVPLRAENVVGPLTLAAFQADQQRLGLPRFTRTLSDLK